MDSQVKRIVHDLRLALQAALLESPEAAAALERLRREGLSVALVVKEAEGAPSVDLSPPRPRRPEVSPEFRIGGQDLAFLRSVGIDPTRRPPARSRRRKG